MKASNPGKRYWRSLSELENSPEFDEFLQREFPVAAAEFPDGISRRRWLQLMAASLAFGGLAGCRYREEKFAPLAKRPEDWVPGKPQRYATSIELAGATRHLLVTCYDGRPIKVEGNPDHPYSLGATDLYSQACVLDLYDPDRCGDVRQRDQGQAFIKTWDDFAAFADKHFQTLKDQGGAGLCVLLEPTESAAVHGQLSALKAAFPKAELFSYAPLARGNERRGAELAFGKAVRTHLNLDKAQIIVCLDADLLGDHPASLRLARQFADGRDVARAADPKSSRMNRLYVAESQYSTTGAMADHRLAVRSLDIGALVADLAKRVQAMLDAGKVQNPTAGGTRRDRILQAMAADLFEHRGAGVIAVGPRQPAEIHAQVHRLNALLEHGGKTVTYTDEPAAGYAAPCGDLTDLAKRMQAGQVKTLVLLGGNPVYDAPADLEFEQALAKVGTAIHLSSHENETSQRCQWLLPQTHPFETWGDCRAQDGTICVTQPLIETLLGGKSTLELLALLLGDKSESQTLVRRSVDRVAGRALSDKEWRKLLHDGFLADSGLKPASVELKELAAGEAKPAAEGELELVFCRSETVYDGRFANNGWLQETPHLVSKLTWDNAALVSPATAKKLGLEIGSMVRLELDGRSLEIPAFILPGQADGSIGVALGYGRTSAGLVGGSAPQGIAPVGVNVTPLRTTVAMDMAAGVKVTPIGGRYSFALTQDHHAIDKVGLEAIGHRVGELIREGTHEQYQADPDFAQHTGHKLESLWKEVSYDEHQAWGMSIDLNKCIGCNACSVACQAENNVPVVGKDQVARGREMHWIRIDRYFRGSGAEDEDLQVVHQPVMCQQCENAPCEQVCPVAATVHSREGLNDMVYNRCIGTRYCANNCPYKVRRFNFFNNTKHLEDPDRQLMQLVVNPEVTVRSRGVMEKCTYCVQRIQNAKIDARSEGRLVRDGEIQTACQQVCPTRAIEFGDLNKDTRVAKSHQQDPRAYGMLAELNVKPRTVYLARLRNPHPALAAQENASAGHAEVAVESGKHL
jgi:molybdopterin-containing oxidoreductase family iron-sulfur binding subunit